MNITSRITTNQMRFSQVNCVCQRNGCQHFSLTSIRINAVGVGGAATHCPNGLCLVNPIQTNYDSIHFRWSFYIGMCVRGYGCRAPTKQMVWMPFPCYWFSLAWTRTIHKRVAQNKTPKMAFINGIFGLSAKQLNSIQSIPNMAFPDE